MGLETCVVSGKNLPLTWHTTYACEVMAQVASAPSSNSCTVFRSFAGECDLSVSLDHEILSFS